MLCAYISLFWECFPKRKLGTIKVGVQMTLKLYVASTLWRLFKGHFRQNLKHHIAKFWQWNIPIFCTQDSRGKFFFAGETRTNILLQGKKISSNELVRVLISGISATHSSRFRSPLLCVLRTTKHNEILCSPQAEIIGDELGKLFGKQLSRSSISCKWSSLPSFIV